MDSGRVDVTTCKSRYWFGHLTLNEIVDMADGRCDLVSECDQCHQEGAVWVDRDTPDGGEWQYCRSCLLAIAKRWRTICGPRS